MKPLPPETDLRTRKLLLQQRSAVLREVLAVQLERTLAPVNQVANKAQEGGRWLRKHPILVGVAAAALLVWRPQGAVSLLSRGWGLWKTWQRIAPVVSRWMAQAEARSASGAGSDSETESMPTHEPTEKSAPPKGP